MPLVVDANVAIKWIVLEEQRSEALSVLERFTTEIEAPDFMLAEIANVVWVKQRRGEITLHEAEEGIRFIRNQIQVVHSSLTLCEHAFALARHLNHPVYDCLYVACAEAANALLITADRRLHAVAERAGLGYRVRHLADIPS